MRMFHDLNCAVCPCTAPSNKKPNVKLVARASGHILLPTSPGLHRQLLLRSRCALCSIRGTLFLRCWRMMMRSSSRTLLQTAWLWCDLLECRADGIAAQQPCFAPLLSGDMGMCLLPVRRYRVCQIITYESLKSVCS